MGSGLTPEQRQKVEEIRLKAQRTMRREGDADRAFLLSLVEELDQKLQAAMQDTERLDWLTEERADLTFRKRAWVDYEELKVNRWTVAPYRGLETFVDWGTPAKP